MTNIRFYKVVIIILVLLNLGTLGFLWLAPPRSGSLPERGQAAEFLIRELRLTPIQRDEFGKMRDEHSARLSVLQEQDRKLHDRFFDAIFLPVPDTSSVNMLCDSIAGVRKQMEMLTFEHFANLRQLLTINQRVKFQRVFRQALDRVMPMPPAPPVPPPPPPPPG
jgi:periplasmic protein CpxP/Spy